MLDMNPTTLSKFNVWLVDDERDIFAMMLPGMTHEPSVRLFRWYPNCDSALTAVTEEPAPDVIILDINMPGMNGVDAIPLFQKNVPFRKNYHADGRPGHAKHHSRHHLGRERVPAEAVQHR